MAVRLLDISRQYEYLQPELDRAVLDVVRHGQFILGPEVSRLEEEIAKLCGVRYAVGVASGTDALLIALRAAGVGAGDEVITSDFSFFASAGVIARLGARPVFVDIDKRTYNIDVGQIERAITSKTKAILPVHLYGQVADMDPIMQIARDHDLKVVEDAAQAIGATYKNRKAGSIGDFGCFSFYPSKNLGGGGDGGMIVMDDQDSYKLCRSLRAHGENPKYYHRLVGYNSRLHSLQAAFLLVKLPYLTEWTDRRRENARRYDEALAGLTSIATPGVEEYSSYHIYNQYTLASPRREEILAGLQTAAIDYCIYYPVPFHAQDCFAYLNFRPEQFPVATKAAQEVFSIPIYPELRREEQSEVIDVISRLA